MAPTKANVFARASNFQKNTFNCWFFKVLQKMNFRLLWRIILTVNSIFGVTLALSKAERCLSALQHFFFESGGSMVLGWTTIFACISEYSTELKTSVGGLQCHQCREKQLPHSDIPVGVPPAVTHREGIPSVQRGCGVPFSPRTVD